MKKLLNKYAFLVFGFVTIVLYVLTIRGNMGVPSVEDVTFNQIASGQPFETSQERARWATMLSLYHYRSFSVDKFPQMGTPDVGFIDGHYFSFFPPAVSIFALPLYFVGLKVGATQLLVFLVSTIFAFATGVLIYKYCRKLSMSNTKSAFSAFAFLFATNAWGYSVTLYAHLVSAFFILCGVYILHFSKRNWVKGFLIWALYVAAVFIDFPNLFLYFPIALVYSLQGLGVVNSKNKFGIRIGLVQLVTPLVFLAGVVLYGYYNYTQFGDSTTLSNNLPRVRNLTTIEGSAPELGRDTTSALNTRRLLGGYVVLLFSGDRGLLIYAPVILLGVFGMIAGYKRGLKELAVLALIPLVCITLYSMFSDPWGGWAFGSRYMIASYPYLLILASYGLENIKGRLVKLVYSFVFIYSAAISLLAPLTTNVIPPSVEAGSLGLVSDYSVNWKMLLNSDLNSFIYNNFLVDGISGLNYYFFILFFTIVFGLSYIWVGSGKEAK